MEKFRGLSSKNIDPLPLQVVLREHSLFLIMSRESYEEPNRSTKASMEQVRYVAGSDTPSSSNTSARGNDDAKGDEEIGEPLAWTFSKWLTDVRGFGGIQHNKHLAVTYRGLTVQGKSRQKAFANTVWSKIDPRNLAAVFRKDRSTPRVC